MLESRVQVQESQPSCFYRATRNSGVTAFFATMVVVAFMLGGCAADRVDSQAVAKNPADVIGSASSYTTLKAPPADKALVCFLRPSGFVGMIVPWFFIESEKIICTLPNGTFYHILMTPRTHKLSFKAGPGAEEFFMTLELQGGKIYCLLGGISGRMALQTPEEANALIPKLTFRKQAGDI